MENLKDATQTLHQLKSRGVTRFVDLNKANKQELGGVEEHEEEMSADEGPEHKRRRLGETLNDDELEYTPSEPPNQQKSPEILPFRHFRSSRCCSSANRSS